MSNLLIVFHSQSGRNESIALRCYQKATSLPELQVRLRRAIDGSLDDLKWADFLLLITPENFGAIAGEMKGFFDRVFYPSINAGIAALPYCCIIDTGNDGAQTIFQINRIMKGLASEPVQEPMLIYGTPSEDDFGRCEELVEAIACALDMGIY